MGDSQGRQDLPAGGINTEKAPSRIKAPDNDTAKADNSTERDKFIHELHQNHRKDMEIVKKKNGDYAQGHDPFQNFRMVEDAGLMTIEQGIAVRMSDKLQRIFNLLDSEAEVDDETLEDTLTDLRNYANILQVYLNWEE